MDWDLILLLVGVSLPGILLAVPRTIDSLMELVTERRKPGQELPPYSVLVLISVVQATLLVGLAAGIGGATAQQVGFRAPVFTAALGKGSVWAALEPQLVPAAAVSIFGSAVFLLAYYGFFRPRLGEQTVTAMDGLRQELGIVGRVLYGGVAEEVLARWGLMSLITWIGLQLVGNVSAPLIWTAIVVSGILFGLGHLPSYLGAGCRNTPMFLSTMVFLNLWASLIFGWLFWQYGLEAAMLSHVLFHLFWAPLERYVVN